MIIDKHPSPSIDPAHYPSEQDWMDIHDAIEEYQRQSMDAAIEAIECGDIDHNFHINVTYACR